jgi:hypothetical protein
LFRARSLLWELLHFRCTVYTRIAPTDVQVVTIAVVVNVIMSQPSSGPGSIPSVSTQVMAIYGLDRESWIEMGAATHPCAPSPGTAGIQVFNGSVQGDDARLQRALREQGRRPGIIWDMGTRKDHLSKPALPRPNQVQGMANKHIYAYKHIFKKTAKNICLKKTI